MGACSTVAKAVDCKIDEGADGYAREAEGGEEARATLHRPEQARLLMRRDRKY